MYLKHFKYNMVPKLIGSEVVSINTTHMVKPLKYVPIDMNLNFMHIIAIKNLMDLPYILDQIRQTRHVNLHIVNMHAQAYQNPGRYKLYK